MGGEMLDLAEAFALILLVLAIGALGWAWRSGRD